MLPLQGKRAASRAANEKRIIEAAESLLGTYGAAGLSLRHVAKQVGMAPSAIYRYYNGIDSLYTALILRAYNDQARAAQEAFAGVKKPANWAEAEEAMVIVTKAIRSWALENPHRYALIYGSPVPGYRAPEETIAAAAATGQVLIQCVPVEGADPIPAEMVRMWVQLYGVISFELFGHLKGSIDDASEFFEETVRLGVKQLRTTLEFHNT